MSALLLDSAGKLGEIRLSILSRLAHRDRGSWLGRVAVHVACWVPFIATAAVSWRGPWRAVGDNAHLALQSWNTLSGWIPLVGQPNELPGSPHDLGPLQYWLLTVPVHADPSRGVLWGAVLLAMLAVSLTVEAGYSVLAEKGAVLAGATVVAVVAWLPQSATRVEDNPNFGLIFFLPTLAACLAVLCGHRKWWPVLVVTASIATQSHLTFAAASFGLVLAAAATGVVDELRAERRFSWLIAGLIAGAACWIAPLEQQFTALPGKGNMWLLLHAEHARPHVGFGYALKALGSMVVPSRLWWQQNVAQRRDLFQFLGSHPAASGVVILVILAASLALAAWWLRSRELSALAGITLLVTGCAVTSFALVPGRQDALAGQQHDLVYVLFTAVLLVWLTVIGTAVLAGRDLLSSRLGTAGRAPGRREAARWHIKPLLLARGATGLLAAIAIFLAAQQVAAYLGAGTNSLHVGAALARIERTVPKQPAFGLSVTSTRKSDKFQVLEGLCWALTADGYHADTYHPGIIGTGHHHALPQIAIRLRGSDMRITTIRTSPKTRGQWRSCNDRPNQSR